tara:strand:+ start:5483 stop:6955 length:1473 start_codon:yes stop_codon:yes gene_type:complete
MKFPEYDIYDGLGLADLIAKKQLSSQELLDAAFERIDTLNPYLNAVVNKMVDEAQAQLKTGLAAGPFHGVPLLLKDLITSYAGVPTTGASKWTQHYTRDYDSELVARYKKAGFVILGKTNCPEWGLGATTEPKLFGATHNPWNLNHTVGGSSGGSAAAVASRMVPIAHGGDGGGSLRIPASCCGVFGLKPTRGRTPSGPDRGRMWQGWVGEHVITRTVRDSAAVLDISCGDDIGTPLPLPKPDVNYLQCLEQDVGKLKIAVMKMPFYPAELHQDCLDAVNKTAKLCESLGHEIEEIEFDVDVEAMSRNTAIMMAGDIASLVDMVKANVKMSPRDLELATRAIAKVGNRMSAKAFAGTSVFFDEVTRKLGDVFEKYDVILTPTLAQPPKKLGELTPSGPEKFALWTLMNVLGGVGLTPAFFKAFKKGMSFTPFTALFNATGNPAMSVPLYWNKDGLPIGVQFAGRFADEQTLFQLAHQLEQAQPWRAKKTS